MALCEQPMRNRFDYLSRRIGKDALATSGTIVAGDIINPETQYADLRHEPDPARHAERARLGLLGRLAAVPCLLEVYSRLLAPRMPARGCYAACGITDIMPTGGLCRLRTPARR